MTTVIHVRDADFTDPNTVYIGRPIPLRRLAGSRWSNPYRITRGQSRETVLARYRTYLIEYRPDLVAALPELRGKTLACWCAPEACHGDILAGMADAQMAEASGHGR